jgi:hypothetical protein
LAFGFLAFCLLVFAIDFCNKLLASQHTKCQKSSSERAFQFLVYFLRSQFSSFSKASATARLLVLASGCQKPAKAEPYRI